MDQKPEKDMLAGEEIVKALNARKYGWLSFLAKVAFICNVCSVFMIFASRWMNAVTTIQVIQRTIVILGVLAIFVNLILQAIFFIFRVTKKEIPVAAWLRIFNLAALGIQLVAYFIIPGK